MRNLVKDRPGLTRQLRDRLVERVRIADEETELAFHRVWLARELRKLPTPRRRAIDLPPDAASGVPASIDGLRAACGINPLPHRLPH